MPDKNTRIWTTELVDELRQRFLNNKLEGSYGKFEVERIAEHIDKHMSTNVIFQCDKFFVIF